MGSRRRIRRMRRRGLACRDFGRECDMQAEHDMIHHGPDGRTFQVRRSACTYCGRQVLTAREQSGLGGVEANF